jgi:hypothetical protein
VNWYEDGADIAFTPQEDGTYHTSSRPRGSPVPATMLGRYLPGKKVPDYSEISFFVPRATTDESGVTEGGLYHLGPVQSARGHLREHGGAVAWKGDVPLVRDGQPTAIKSGKSEHFITYGTSNYTYHHDPE